MQSCTHIHTHHCLRTRTRARAQTIFPTSVQLAVEKLQDHRTGNSFRQNVLWRLKESCTKGKYLPLALILLMHDQIFNLFFFFCF